jgi:hypothetical protein
MVNIAEPEMGNISKPEEQFRKAIVSALKELLEQKRLEKKCTEYFIMNDFLFDVAIFIKTPNNTVLRFFELKAYVAYRKGRVNISKGPQLDLLRQDDSNLNLADESVRWLLVDGTLNKGDKRFFIFDSIKAKKAVKNLENKEQAHYNLKVEDLRQCALTWGHFLEKIETFLL